MNHVAVIGAGPAGLVSAKALAECNIEATVFEKSTDVGGVWNPENGPTWEGMRTNLSSHTCAFSDYKNDVSNHDFPTVPEMQDYLKKYAKNFGIDSSVSFESRVERITPNGKKWDVTIQDKDGTSRVDTFEGVIVASGFFSQGPLPEIPGRQDFKGSILHSSQYRSHKEFAGKKVVIVGNSVSGVEICADVCASAESVTHLVRTPSWIVPRYLHDDRAGRKIPLDLVFYRRSEPGDEKPLSIEDASRRRNRYLSGFTEQNELDHQALSINPDSERPFHVAISDNYVSLVKQKAIDVRRAETIDRLKANQVRAGEHCIEADVIIFATGFKFDLPFLNDDIKEKMEFDSQDGFQPAILFKSTLLNNLPNFAFVGAYKGPYFATMELQARFAAKTLSEGGLAIDEESYQAGLSEERSIRARRPRPQFPHGDYVAFSDGLARLTGCYPEVTSDDPMYRHIYGDPVVPAHYRLTGPNSDVELARRTITDLNTAMFGHDEDK